MSSRINARIDDELARKIEALSRATGKSASAILKAALEAYLERPELSAEARPMLALAGFVGCASGDAELSSTYKRSLTKSLSTKT
jgi:metal-responsive CopG/Arc/MetJ family transcriptional regulator